MKFIHLSDLHLGKHVNGFSMIEDQRYILKEILTIINKVKPDGILVAGDVYDRNIPSEDAIKIWDWFLNSLAEKKIPVFAISGNHDSPIRFSAHSALVETTGIYLSPEYDGNAKCYTLKDKDGSVNIYLLPFIEPRKVRGLFLEDTIENYTDACNVAIRRMNVNKKERNILVAHQLIIGSTHCDSEVSVGGLDGVDVFVFADFDYVALGHLHGKQKIGRETVRYCGTPLKYSFSEKDHKKSVTIVEIKAKGEVIIDEELLVPMHDMRDKRNVFGIDVKEVL